MSLSVHGELDLAAGPALKKALEDALRDGTSDSLIVDLADVTFLDCSGISALVYGRHLATEQGVEYKIRNATGMPLTVLRMTGVLDGVPS